MAAKIIFRLDDICPDMNYKNFRKIKELFFRYNIKPIIGVIPNCRDEVLKYQAQGDSVDEIKFWKEIKELQDEQGWDIALHGFDHVYISKDSGIFGTNKRAEFAGLPYDVQYKKIKEGKKILESKGLTVKAFMAPSHSLDWNTVKALKENGIFVITDGISAFPYVKNGMLFIPQISSWPQKRLYGIDTVCFHVNCWTDKMFEELKCFLEYNKPEVITLSEAKVIRGNWLLNVITFIKVKTRRVLAFIKHDILKK